LSGALLSGDAISGSTDTGLNAYDPSLENDLNNMTGSELTGDTSFGFTGADETSATSPADTSTTANPSDTGTSKTELLNLIRRHELNK